MGGGDRPRARPHPDGHSGAVMRWRSARTAGSSPPRSWRQDGAAGAVADGRELARHHPRRHVNRVAFSPDGKLLATASGLGQHGAAWRWRTAVSVARVTHDGVVRAVAFSPDGKLLATASADKTARLWSTTLDDMLQQLCRGPGRNLSPREWRLYLGDLPWQPTCESWTTPPD